MHVNPQFSFILLFVIKQFIQSELESVNFYDCSQPLIILVHVEKEQFI